MNSKSNLNSNSLSEVCKRKEEEDLAQTQNEKHNPAQTAKPLPAHGHPFLFSAPGPSHRPKPAQATQPAFSSLPSRVRPSSLFLGPPFFFPHGLACPHLPLAPQRALPPLTSDPGPACQRPSLAPRPTHRRPAPTSGSTSQRPAPAQPRLTRTTQRPAQLASAHANALARPTRAAQQTPRPALSALTALARHHPDPPVPPASAHARRPRAAVPLPTRARWSAPSPSSGSRSRNVRARNPRRSGRGFPSSTALRDPRHPPLIGP